MGRRQRFKEGGRGFVVTALMVRTATRALGEGDTHAVQSALRAWNFSLCRTPTVRAVLRRQPQDYVREALEQDDPVNE